MGGDDPYFAYASLTRPQIIVTHRAELTNPFKTRALLFGVYCAEKLVDMDWNIIVAEDPHPASAWVVI